MNTRTEKKADSVRAIDRAIDVLECFPAKRHSLSITEIEKRTRLSRPTLYRILATLIRRGFVRKDGEPAQYQLDINAGRLGEAWTNSLDAVSVAAPLLQDLLNRHDETVALYLRRDKVRLCVSEMQSRQALSYSRGLGYSGSLARGASGLAILAHVGPGEAQRIISEEYGSTGIRALQRKLSEIRRDGYALSGGDFIEGAQAIASVVFGRDGEAIGSLGLFGPSARFSPRRTADCAKDVKQVALRLSELLGFRKS